MVSLLTASAHCGASGDSSNGSDSRGWECWAGCKEREQLAGVGSAEGPTS